MREIVGAIDGIGNDFIILKVAYRIRIPEGELKKWSGKLRKGLKVGILLMDNGDVRVRLIKKGEGYDTREKEDGSAKALLRRTKLR